MLNLKLSNCSNLCIRAIRLTNLKIVVDVFIPSPHDIHFLIAYAISFPKM